MLCPNMTSRLVRLCAWYLALLITGNSVKDSFTSTPNSRGCATSSADASHASYVNSHWLDVWNYLLPCLDILVRSILHKLKVPCVNLDIRL